MNKKIEFKKNELKNIANKIVELAKKNNKIKPISEAFTEVPTSEEDHKGKLNYFSK